MTDKAELIDARKAAKIAKETLESLIPRAKMILLEEVEMAHNNQEPLWHITLSFEYSKEPFRSKIVDELAFDFYGDRKYKTFTIDARTGEVLAMKIRAL